MDGETKTKINITRLVIGGLVAGVIMNAVSLLSAGLYVPEMMELLHSRDIQPPGGALSMVVFLLMRFIWGFVAVWLYVAARPRFGPGPKTAALIGFVFWLGGVFLAVVSYGMMGMFPMDMLAKWATITFVGILASTIIGAWIYQE